MDDGACPLVLFSLWLSSWIFLYSFIIRTLSRSVGSLLGHYTCNAPAIFLMDSMFHPLFQKEKEKKSRGWALSMESFIQWAKVEFFSVS